MDRHGRCFYKLKTWSTILFLQLPINYIIIGNIDHLSIINHTRGGDEL